MCPRRNGALENLLFSIAVQSLEVLETLKNDLEFWSGLPFTCLFQADMDVGPAQPRPATNTSASPSKPHYSSHELRLF
jgi:hypothetical protein